MKKTIHRIAFGTMIITGVLSASAAPKPNILFIFTDDQRFNSIGYDNPEVKTPNLDKLAKRGAISKLIAGLRKRSTELLR